ncbi:MAG: GNAT family N-acetyltransferase [Bacteroidaceae bacterium]|nr:GNAT family N-acetyltransferase [Bacteroidaceae bacterium]
MPELLTYTHSDFTDLASLMQELSGNIVFTRESLDRMLADPNSHLYVIREEGRIVACASLCIFHQPFSTDATIESVVVSSKMIGKGLGRKLMELLIGEAARMKVDCIHLTSNPKRVAANALYQKLGFERKETNCYTKKIFNENYIQ